jgi:hypothetical protein
MTDEQQQDVVAVLRRAIHDQAKTHLHTMSAERILGTEIELDTVVNELACVIDDPADAFNLPQEEILTALNIALTAV